MGAQGMTMKLTDASTKRLRRAVEKWQAIAADGDAWYKFDYETQEAVIFVNDGRVVPLPEFMAKGGA
jgi:hypothetical protein